MIDRMNKNLIAHLLIVLIFGSSNLAAQNFLEESEPIEIGNIITIESEIMGEERKLYISLPHNYESIEDELPVVYVLDAEYRFNIAQSIQSYFGITTRIPPAILVGIANPSRDTRNRDLLPESYGGEADQFIEFIEFEAFPFVEENFKVSDQRFIIGHSHGGVFAVHTLLNRSDLFDGYAAIDPSLKFIYGKNDTLLTNEYSGKKLYLTSSDVAYGYMEDIKADIQNDFNSFVSLLDQHQPLNKLSYKIDHIADDHGNSYIQGFSRAYRFLFNWRFE